jgi:two-component system sensor histidine kinase/response regulator
MKSFELSPANRAARRSEKRYRKSLRRQKPLAPLETARHFAVAFAAVLAALAIKFALIPYIGTDAPSLFFFGAIIVAAWRGGFLPGLLATGLATLLLDYFFIAPNQMFWRQDFGSSLKLAIFFIENVFICVLCHWRLQSERAARRAHEELEEKIERRTKRLKASESELRTLLAAMRDVILVLNHKGDYLKVVQNNKSLLCRPAEDLIGKNIRDVLAPDKAAAFLENVREVTESTESLNFEYSLEIDKQEKWFSAVVSPLPNKQVLWVARDITERKKIEDALSKSERRNRDLIDKSLGFVVFHTLDGVILSVNSAAAATLGYERSEINGKRLTDFVPETAHTAVADYLREIGERGAASGLMAVIAKNGEQLFLIYNNTLYADEGEEPFVLGHALDVTDRRRIEQELKKARDAALESANFKTAFLANVSHEIRTPMNGIVGMTDLLLDTPLNAQQRDFAETIRSSADALLTIINDILDISKIEAGKLELEHLDFDLPQVVEDAVYILAERAEAKNLELTLHIEANVPASLNGDPNRLRQVLLNLLSNAIKFTAQGEIFVGVSLYGEIDSDTVLKFVVCDTGIGIDHAAQKRLFEPFVQADVSTIRRFGGTGLGLAISKQLVEMMNGEIGLESSLGEGSRFWFTARFAKPNAAPQFTAQPIENRVLIIEPNAAARRALTDILLARNIETAAFADAADVLRQLENAATRKPRLIDFVLLAADAPRAAEFTSAVGSDFVIVLMTKINTAKTCLGSFVNRVAAAVTKPVRQKQLFEILAKLAGDAPRDFQPPQPKIVERDFEITATNGGKILLVEDNPVNQKVAVSYLRKFGFAVDVATNGREAIEAVYRNCYDLVLMDCQMPEMDGYEATATIRACEARGEIAHRTPIIAMTASAMSGDREHCFAVGMDDYLAKPIEPSKLREVVSRWCDGGKKYAVPRRNGKPRAAKESLNAAVDDSALAEFANLETENPGFLADLIELFLQDTAQSVARLRTLAAKNNLREINFLAHKIKGSSGTFGAKYLSRLCQELEQSCRADDLSAARRLTLEVQNEFARVKEHFQTIFKFKAETTT